MKNKYILIILVFFVAYAVYTSWYSEVLQSDTQIPKKKEQASEKPLDEKIISTKSIEISKTPPLKSNKNQANKAVEKSKNTIIQTLDASQVETQEVYDALVPEAYETLREEAEVAFEKLDEELIHLDEKIAQEEMLHMQELEDRVELN